MEAGGARRVYHTRRTVYHRRWTVHHSRRNLAESVPSTEEVNGQCTISPDSVPKRAESNTDCDIFLVLEKRKKL